MLKVETRSTVTVDGMTYMVPTPIGVIEWYRVDYSRNCLVYLQPFPDAPEPSGVYGKLEHHKGIFVDQQESGFFREWDFARVCRGSDGRLSHGWLKDAKPYLLTMPADLVRLVRSAGGVATQSFGALLYRTAVEAHNAYLDGDVWMLVAIYLDGHAEVNDSPLYGLELAKKEMYLWPR